jgi:hypothetical protein
LYRKYLLFQKNLSYLVLQLDQEDQLLQLDLVFLEDQQVRLDQLLHLYRKYLLFQKNLSYLVLQLDQEDR